MAPLKTFKTAATKDERAELAKAVGTSEDYLFHHLGKHREFPLDKAIAVEEATRGIATRNGGITPVVQRTNLCLACGSCPHACATREYPGGA